MCFLPCWAFAQFPDVPSDVKQLLVVRVTRVPEAVMTLYEREGGAWKKYREFPVVVGKNGVALVGEKREGDGRTPGGLMRLGPAFGYAASAVTKLPYRQATRESKYIDDVNSPQYNQWVEGATTAKSFEVMRRADGQYELGIVVRYNEEPVKTAHGSAIFLHIWKGPKEGTAGCVGMSKERMREVLAWVRPGALLALRVAQE